MSQTKDFCRHFKVLWDNHPSSANCFHCSRQNTCEICCSWPLSTWLKFEQRRSYKPGWKEEICTYWDVRGRWPFWSWRINNCSPYEQSGGISSSDDIVPLNTDQPDRPRAKRRGSQCGTPPSGSGFSHWKVRSHSSPDRFTGQRSLGESTSGEFVDKSTGHRRDRTGQKSPTKSTEPDRTGPDQTGCQSPDESTGHGTGPNWVSISRRVHRSRDSRAIYRSKDIRLVYRSAQTVFCTTWKNSNGAKVIHWTAYYNSVYGT